MVGGCVVVKAVLLAAAMHLAAARCTGDISRRLFRRNSLAADVPPVSGRSCTSDAECIDYRTDSGEPTRATQKQPKSRLGEYACIGGSCRYTVKAGELCFSAHDCAAFQLEQWWEEQDAGNSTLLLRRAEQSSQLAHAWCAPEFCTLESTCGGAWTLDGAPHDTPPGADSSKPITNGTVSCCRGFLAEAQCGVYGGAVDTCSTGYVCSAKEGRCGSQEPHQQIWIGVLLVLIGGVTLNLGLNLQKYAFRKRQEKDAAQQMAECHAPDGVQSLAKPSEVVFYSSDALCSGGGAMQARARSGSTVSATFPLSADNVHNRQGRGAVPLRSESLGIIAHHESPGMSRVSLAHSVAARSIQEAQPQAAAGRWRRLQRTPMGSPIWILGLSIFIVGNVINFIALQFAPQSLVAPLGAVSLVTNVIVAPLLNNERIGMFDIGGIALIIAGCVIVVVFSGIVQQDFRLCILVQLLRARPTIIFLCLISAAIVAVYTFLWVVERGLGRYHEGGYRQLDGDDDDSYSGQDVGCKGAEAGAQHCSDHSLPYTTQSTRRPRSSSCGSLGEDRQALPEEAKMAGARKLLTRLRAAQGVHPLMLLDPYIRPIAPTSRHVRYGLPLAYASLGSLMAALTTLFAKSLVNLLSASLFDHDNQFTSFVSWAILLVTAFTAASQVYWINQGLQRYDALLQVPVFYVVWTVFDIIGGGVYFNEFRLFTTVKYVLFVLGVAVIFSGVGLLANRLKHN